MADDHEKGRFEQRQQDVQERRTEQEQEWIARPEEQQRKRARAAPARARRTSFVRRAAADPFGELERRHGLEVRPDLSAEERVVRVLARMDDERVGS
jgi:hypothetical protein